jgi:hypothetical protein
LLPLSLFELPIFIVHFTLPVGDELLVNLASVGTLSAFEISPHHVLDKDSILIFVVADGLLSRCLAVAGE